MFIGKKWQITSDGMNVTLLRRVTRKPKGKPSYEDWGIVGYYATVANALRALVNQGVRDTELVDLRTVVDKIDELQKQIIKGLRDEHGKEIR